MTICSVTRKQLFGMLNKNDRKFILNIFAINMIRCDDNIADALSWKNGGKRRTDSIQFFCVHKKQKICFIVNETLSQIFLNAKMLPLMRRSICARVIPCW